MSLGLEFGALRVMVECMYINIGVYTINSFRDRLTAAWLHLWMMLLAIENIYDLRITKALNV